MLVIEGEGRRHRFPATPEPPSLSGAAPGTWRLSFTVPAELAHGLGGHVWLALGTVTVPLPVPESARPTAEPEPAEPAPAEPEPAEPAPAERAPAEPAPAEPEEPPGEVAASEPAPERDLGRLEIERAWRRADAAERTAGELGERVTALERALERERAERARRPPPAEPVIPGGAERERLRAEDALRAARRAAGPRVPAEPPALPAALPAPTPAASVPVPAAAAAADLAEGGAGGPEATAALRRELRVRVAAEAALHARTVQAETRLAARVVLEQRTTAALAELRTELERLGDALEHERALRRAAEESAARLRAALGGQRERSRDAHAAIEELRSAIELLRPAAPPPAPGSAPALGSGSAPAPGFPPGGEGVTPDRLSDALSRLRQNTEPREQSEPGAPLEPPATRSAPSFALAPVGARSPVGVGGPTVEQPFRRLAARDPERAGRLVIGLLGAQRAAWPHAVAYDLLLGAGYGTVQVTAGERTVSVQRSGAARTSEQVAFQIAGGPDRLARLLAAGPLRRLLRIGLARVRGRREGLSALSALLALPLDLGALRAAGVALDGETLFTLLAAMIEPGWTHGERFTVSHTDERSHTVFLQIRDGEPPLASREPPAGRVATALSGSVEGLWRMFADGGSAAPAGDASVLVSGDLGPLTLVRTWANRAQSGHGAR